MKRIEQKFLELKAKKQCAFVAYICAGDPDYKTSLELLKELPAAGAYRVPVARLAAAQAAIEDKRKATTTKAPAKVKAPGQEEALSTSATTGPEPTGGEKAGRPEQSGRPF